MKIQVTRTSAFNDLQNQPVPEAFLSDLPKYTWDHRIFKSPEEFDEKRSYHEGTWLSEGTDHRCDADGIYRKMPQEGKAWYIRLSSFKDLYEFVQKYGDCVISDMSDELCIEIYDTYRE